MEKTNLQELACVGITVLGLLVGISMGVGLGEQYGSFVVMSYFVLPTLVAWAIIMSFVRYKLAKELRV